MRNAIYNLAITALAAAALTVPLSAQAPTTYKADVPFEFTVGDTALPAGQYDITPRADGLVFLTSGDARCYFLSLPKDRSSSAALQPELLFNRYGDRYFLSLVTTGSYIRELPVSRAEGELRKANLSAARHGQTRILLALR
jgi:hypothetical protein